MKQSSLVVLLLTLSLGATAQNAVFTDNFNNGSTTNHASIPGGTPTASFTSYDIASSKAATTAPAIGSGRLRLSLNAATGSGFIEAQALFAGTPVSLITVGDYINLTYTFTNTSGTLLAGGTSSYILQGLFNSAGAPPVAGLLNNSGLNSTTTGSTFATNNCANWQGYASRISSGSTSQAYTRPVQNGPGTTPCNQDLIGNGFGGGTYTNPPGTTIDVNETATVALTSGNQYTVSYTIALTDVGTLTITNCLYDGVGTGGSLIFSQTNTATTTNVPTTSFDGLAIGVRNSGTSFNPTMDVTSISVTANIAGTPGPSFTVTGGGTGCPGDAFIVGLSGSVTTNDYRIFTNGVFNGVVQTGTGAAFNFPAETVVSVALTNTVQASNTVSGFTGFMSGEVLVGPFAAPVITTQPSPALVATNSTAFFTVVSSGTGLNYQWYKGGTKLTDGEHISGSGTSTLVVSPATTADAAVTAQGYYVVVTNTCGLSTTSITNSLTLQASGNLVWQGGNPNNVWDLLTTANFTNGAGPVVFQSGDNVTFDDTSIFPVVSISGNFVTPGLITESANQGYFFTGNGIISGPGALLMSGPGILTISNANTYTGGTTISNGTVALRNFSALGLGPVTLAGGILENTTSGSASLAVTNDINVVANSTLQYDTSGTFACVLRGALTGNPNTTLTLYNFNNNTAFARLRLYSPFTNNANVVLNSAGTEMEIAPYLTNGDQVFNGVISGTAGRFVPRSNGNVIFNNTNTFNDTSTAINIPSGTTPGGYSLLLSGGNAGIGADSISTTPPTIDASPIGTGKLGINVGTEGGTCGLFSSGGSHTIGNIMAYTSSTNTVTLVLGGTNNLTFSGEFDLANSGEAAGTNRTLQVTNTAATTISGTVSDNGVSGGAGIIKTGNGALYLNGANTYTGSTTNMAGLLAGSGTIAGPVDVETNGSIGGGTAAAIGTLTINNSLTVNGNVSIKVNKALSPAQSNDLVSVSGTLSSTGIGTLTVNNVGTALVVGDKFKVFNKAVSGAGAMTIAGGGMNWANNLAVDGSITASSVNTGPATNPTNIVFSVGGGNLSLSWPGDHLGWFLQMQTNSLTNTATWFDVAGSSTVTNVVIPFNQSLRAVFFRMSLQP